MIIFEQCSGKVVESYRAGSYTINIKQVGESEYCYEVVENIRISDDLVALVFKLREEVFLRIKQGTRDELMKIIDDVVRSARELRERDPKLASMVKRFLILSIDAFDVLTPLFEDLNIEDLNINGVDEPVWVYHSKYGHMRTNIKFTNVMYLRQLIQRLMQRAGRQLNPHVPINDARLVDKYGRNVRISAGLEDVNLKGPYASIRFQRAQAIPPQDMVARHVIPAEVVALIWALLERNGNFFVIGETGSGKTTLMNSILTLLCNKRMVVIEEVPEIQLPCQNSVRLVAKPTYSFIREESGVEMIDLLKQSLRLRPDIIVVGEVRAQEATILMQAINTGHGAAATFHASSTEAAMNRFTGQAIGITPDQLTGLQIMVLIRRFGPGYRRVVAVDEVVPAWEEWPYGHYIKGIDTVRINRIAVYDRVADEHKVDLSRSFYIQWIARHDDVHVDRVMEEIRGKVKALARG